MRFLLPAFAAVLARQPCSLLLIGGIRAEAEEAFDVFKEVAPEAAARVFQVPWSSSPAHLSRMLSLCDMMVFPSLLEGTPNAVLEAMACERCVLATEVGGHPDLITHGDKDKEEKKSVDSSLIVSWDSLERKKNDLEELMQKRIPANSKEIEIAREYGDLRENAEFKAAKEQQKVLMALQAEWESDIDRARGINYADADTSTANVGTRVTVTNLTNNEREEYSLMGAWDGDPDNNRISYLTPLGQAIFGSEPGAEVEVQLGDETRRMRVDSIAPLAS